MMKPSSTSGAWDHWRLPVVRTSAPEDITPVFWAAPKNRAPAAAAAVMLGWTAPA